MGTEDMTKIGDTVLVFPVDGDKENLVALDPSSSTTLDLFDITINEGLDNETFRGLYRSNQTAGENLIFGDLVNYKSDSKWWKTDANTMTMCIGELGLVVEDTLTGATGKIAKIVDARNDSWSWTTGAMLYISIAPGEMTQTMPSGTGNQIRKVAVAISPTLINFAPDCTIIELG